MSDHKVIVERLTIEEHPNADRLEIAQVGRYQSIVGKDQFRTGDLAAYIPEASLVPQELLQEMGLEGKLAGSKGNRVKAVRLRGVLSQGLCYPARDGWEEGQDVTEELSITQYVPPIPTSMQGEVFAAGGRRCIGYDIENFKRYPDALEPGEPVVITEKLHGTWSAFGIMNDELAHKTFGHLVVTSKGLSQKGLAFRPESKYNKNNLYLRAAKQYDILDRVGIPEEPLFILGEVFGSGVQDLSYGHNVRQEGGIGHRVFDVYTGQPGLGRYLSDAELEEFCKQYDLERVPVLWRGPFSEEKMLELTDGPETISGESTHIREGVVVRPVEERRDTKLGRVILKSVSEDYLERKGGTEYS